MIGLDKPTRRLLPEIKGIVADFPNEQDALPKLRALAIEGHARRYRVINAYRLLRAQEDMNHGRR